MTTSPNPLLRANLKSLRLPTMLSEQATSWPAMRRPSNQTFEDYLLRLTELELAAAFGPCVLSSTPIENAGFPVPGRTGQLRISRLCLTLNAKPKDSGVGLAVNGSGESEGQLLPEWVVWARAKATWPSAWVWPPAVSRLPGSLFTWPVGTLVNLLEEKAGSSTSWIACWGNWTMSNLLICDELGHRTFSRSGAELLFQVFADRYERKSLLLTSNLAFSDLGPGLSMDGAHDGRTTGPFDASLPDF